MPTYRIDTDRTITLVKKFLEDLAEASNAKAIHMHYYSRDNSLSVSMDIKVSEE